MLTLHITPTQLNLVPPNNLENQFEFREDIFTFSFQAFDENVCQQSLLDFLKKKNLIGNSAILEISLENIIFREVIWDLPYSEWQAYLTIQRHFSTYFPGYLWEDVYLDFEKVNSKNEHLNPRLKIYAIQKTRLHSYITMAEKAGLKIKRVDIDVLAKQKRSINLFPGREQTVNKKRQFFLRLAFLGLVFSLSTIIIMNYSLNQKIKQLKKHRQILITNMQMLKEKNKCHKGDLTCDQKNKEKVTWILKKAKQENQLAFFLKKLGTLTFTEHPLIQMFFENKQLKLKGVATSNLAVFNFIQNLRSFKEVKQVHFFGSEKQEEKVQFNITIDF